MISIETKKLIAQLPPSDRSSSVDLAIKLFRGVGFSKDLLHWHAPTKDVEEFALKIESSLRKTINTKTDNVETIHDHLAHDMGKLLKGYSNKNGHNLLKKLRNIKLELI